MSNPLERRMAAEAILHDEMQELAASRHHIKQLEAVADGMWGVIANVDRGTWNEQRTEWVRAAERVRDAWHAALRENPA